MAVYEMLCKLTSSDDDRAENFDDKLMRKLQEITPLLTTEIKKKISNQTIREQYLHVLTDILYTIGQENVKNADSLISVSQYRSLKIAIELIVSIGVIPCLLPGVGVDIEKLCPRALEIPQENLDCIMKYERLSFLTNVLVDFFVVQTLRPAVLLHLGTIMAALLQMSYAPLIKPNKSILENVNKFQFCMTVKKYESLQREQKEFYMKLILLLSNCPQYLCIRELMVIHGNQDAPRWLRRCTQNFLINKITQPGGVLSLIGAVCSNDLDIGTDWNKLDTISRLLAKSHGQNADEYYKVICPQILDLFSSDKINHGATIANSCIAALYDCDPYVCQKYVIEVICAPLITTESLVVKSEKKIERCIKTLTKCFLAEDAKFKHLPCKLILHVATPLFCLYNKARKSPCILKNHLRQLLLKILEEETTREELYSAFLGHEMSAKFGDYVTPVFGPTGGLEITGPNRDLRYDELADTISDLILTSKDLSPSIFCYILKRLSSVNKNHTIEKQTTLETEDDRVRYMEVQLTTYLLLSQLASTSVIHDAQAKNPAPLLSFIRFLFDEYTKKQQDEIADNDSEILYLSLMLIKTILMEKKATLDIDLFKDFNVFLKHYATLKIPTQLKSLINEVMKCIETHDKPDRKCYHDLSISSATSVKFDEAMRDLEDRLLPVRAHGLIALTKLIENQDPCTVARRAIILHLFQENLKHEDSFIYLASINGLCALTNAFPREVIETLMPEYVDMPNRLAGAEITVETRTKLGEILVKTTRALGEMSVVLKNTLVNGFLCAARDADSLMRASSLSCLGELCKVLGFRLGNILVEIIYCITCIVKHDKAPECRRAAVLVCTLLFRGLGKDTLISLGDDLLGLYRGLKRLRDDDDDPVMQLHAQLALEEIDQIVQEFLFAPPKLEKKIFVPDLPS